MKIGYQGIEGSNSEAFAKKFVLDKNIKEYELVPLVSSENVVKSLISGEIYYGVMAIRNSIGGVVGETEKAIEGQKLIVVYKDILQIHHCLFKRKDVKIEEITKVASHIQALKQTEKSIKKYFPNCEKIEIEDTAIAARYLYEGKLDKNVAIICKKEAGEKYSLDLVYENIEDKKDNYTEFGVYKIKE